MIIFTGEVTENGTVDVLCSACLRSVAVMGRDEVSDFICRSTQTVYCFDCDSRDCDIVHPALAREVRVWDEIAPGIFNLVFDGWPVTDWQALYTSAGVRKLRQDVVSLV